VADTVSKEKRSWMMSRIKGKDTSIEVKVRHYLFSQGFRYRKNDARFPGKPDIVLPKYKTVVFIHGCFWHQHEGCRDAHLPKSRTEYWVEKLKKNTERDRTHEIDIRSKGWKVIVIWACEINKEFEETMNKVVKAIKGI